MDASRAALALALALGVSGLGLAAGALTIGGALAAALVGALTFWGGGWMPSVLLVAFFLSSSGLSRVGRLRKQMLAATASKGTRRDPGQVLANGALPAVLSALFGVTGNGVWLAAVGGALAAANGDTWATELGVLARRLPRRLVGGEQVEPGTSGGVTAEGFAAAVGGAALIALLAILLGGGWPYGLASVIGGGAGALADSLLGATVQVQYRCRSCGRETEQHPSHTCGGATDYLRGWRWLRNDAVNLAATGAGALVAAVLWSLVY